MKCCARQGLGMGSLPPFPTRSGPRRVAIKVTELGGGVNLVLAEGRVNDLLVVKHVDYVAGPMQAAQVVGTVLDRVIV